MATSQYSPVRSRPTPETKSGGPTSPRRSTVGVVDDVDALLDEIDMVLEDQAVLANFRQRNGQ